MIMKKVVRMYIDKIKGVNRPLTSVFKGRMSTCLTPDLFNLHEVGDMEGHLVQSRER